MELINISIEPFTNQYRDQAIALYIEAFIDNHWYVEMFPDAHLRPQSLQHAAEINIDYIINDMKSYIALCDAKVVGFIWSIDYHKLAKDDKLLTQMFSGSEDSTINPYYDEIDVPVSKLPNVLYILNCAVSKEFRRNNIAKKLIETILNEFHDMHIVADVANSNIINMFESLKFQVTSIEEDYWLCILYPEDNLYGKN